MSELSDVLRQARRRVAHPPAEKEKLSRLSKLLLDRTAAAAKKHRSVKGVVLGGSFAKDTWLPRDVDIDIFVKISQALDDRAFERVGLEIGSTVARGFPRGKKFAQHPYTEASVDGVKVNIVPCFDVTPSNWRSAADRSPYHVLLVERSPLHQKVEVRLLKLFMKGIGVYGAEIERQGFSGYAAEVLTIQHQDFTGVLRYFADFKSSEGGFSFTLLDPVDENRDLARAISLQKLARIIVASRGFLKKPSLAYFTGLKGKNRPALQGRVIGIVFEHALLSEDTIWGELKRSLNHIQKHAEERGFKIARSLAASDGKKSSAFLFLPEFGSLPSLEQRLGPTVDMRKETAEFIRKNSRSSKLNWVGEDGRARILQERAYTRLSQLLADVVKDGGRAVGASEAVVAGMAKSGRVAEGPALAKLAKSSWLKDGISEIVSDTPGTG